MENTNKIFAHIVSIIAATYIAYRLLIYQSEMTFTEKIPTAGGAINNPGNIEKPNGRDTFRGEIVVSDASRFTSFASMAYGYRAIKKILKTKYTEGFKTLRDMISSYAPVGDNNNVDAYVSFVSTASVVSPDTDMSNYSDNIWEDVVKAIGVYEQGQVWLAQYASQNSTWAHDGFTMA